MTSINNLKRLKSERGFTIVELLIVIIVIGILATLVLIAYNNVQSQARDTKRIADTNTLNDASNAFRTTGSTGIYPSTTYGAASGTGTYPAGSFGSDISTISGTLSVDPKLIDKINNTAASPNGCGATPAKPTINNKDNCYFATYCPTGTNATTATGMAYWYFGEKANAPVPNYTGSGSLATCP